MLLTPSKYKEEKMEERIGKITHFYNRIRVAVLEISGELKVGDVVHFVGRTTDFTQGVKSMEIEHQKVESAGAGTEVALKVISRVRKGDSVYKVTEE
jgi:putative protease